MHAILIMLLLPSLSALLIGWDHFGRYRLPQLPASVLTRREILLVMAGILLAPYLALLLPPWLLATLLGLATVRPLAGYFHPILEDRLATWSITAALVGAEVALFVYSGAGNPLFFAINNAIQVMAAVALASHWAWHRLKLPEVIRLSGALVVYAVLTTQIDTLLVHLAGFPFAPVVNGSLGGGQTVVIGSVDLIIAILCPLVLRQEIGRTAGWLALALNGVALAGLVLLPVVGLGLLTPPPLLVLGPLLLGQVGFWHWWRTERRPRPAVGKLVEAAAYRHAL